ncbi:1,2-phenylacetyl-CoA epoxidase subunit PaaD [Aneurinibacillus terranovensis]|uniref:1,2-phenylacetyl-CoA epoxidase subunit PaaD n=1 Tax=Aneurinibacillus terranovensis TaxID=278991 RepID=UPI0003F9BBAB|nr:1,2-phenylacetyl-CoA epoxidase subunit PaaD [Aneurinibacillus terranovensis]
MVQPEKAITEEVVWELLREVKDPEIPSISMVEMGMIHRVLVTAESIRVDVLPTFVGCPAIEMMRKAIIQQLQTLEEVPAIQVHFVFNPHWTSDRISEEGREKLKSFGIAPPPRNHQPGDPWVVDCPYCGSPYTTLDNLFGPTACRSILYCKHCKNPFEALKPV